MYVGHGNHTIQGVEIYKGRPIFYNLGNFAVQRWGQTDSAPTGDGMTMIERAEGDGAGTFQQYINLVALVAQTTYQDGILQEVRLYPVDLGVDRAERPWSQMSVGTHAARRRWRGKILTEVQEYSRAVRHPDQHRERRRRHPRAALGHGADRRRSAVDLPAGTGSSAEDVAATRREAPVEAPSRWRLAFGSVALACSVALAGGGRRFRNRASLTTPPVAERTLVRRSYAGAEACASCHRDRARRLASDRRTATLAERHAACA